MMSASAGGGIKFCFLLHESPSPPQKNAKCMRVLSNRFTVCRCLLAYSSNSAVYFTFTGCAAHRLDHPINAKSHIRYHLFSIGPA
eukprot:scaffold15840_cov142-Skeletonema_marinoi.AAC.7